MTKKATKLTPEQEQAEYERAIDVFKNQGLASIQIARSVAQTVFGIEAEKNDPLLSQRIIDFLDYEEGSGDPNEDQGILVAHLTEAKQKTLEQYERDTPQLVLDVHKLIHEDFFGKTE